METISKPNAPAIVPDSTIPTRTSSKTGKPIRGYVPSVEKVEHRAMYSFYQGLGKHRSLQKVAKEFGKSVPFIATLSRCFQWQARVRTQEQEIKDPVVVTTRGKVDDSRKKLVDVVHDISDTLNEMMILSKDVKAKNEGVLNEIEQKRSSTLIKALEVFGIKIRTPKDMRDLVTVLKDIVDFNTGVITEPSGDVNTQVNIQEMQLVVTDLN